MKKTQTLNIFPASGGLNTIDNVVSIKFDELSEASNVVFRLNGNRRKRSGIVDYVSRVTLPMGEMVMGIDVMGDDIGADSYMRGLFDYWRVVNGVKTQKIVAVVGGKVYSDNNEQSGVFGDITGSVVINPSDRVTFDVFAGALVMAFENTQPHYWTMDGNIQPLGGGAPVGSIYRTYLNSGWIAGVSGSPDVVYKSVDNNPLDWVNFSADSVEINTGDHDPEGITALFPPLFGDLYVAKRTSIYRIHPTDTDPFTGLILFQVTPVISGIGCINHNTAISVNNDVIFASDRGIHSLKVTQNYGDVDTTFLSKPIHRSYMDNVDFSKARNMWAAYSPSDNAYILCYTKRGKKFNQDAFVYDITGGRWSEWNDIDCAAIANFIDSNSRSRLMFGNDDGSIGFMSDDTRMDFDSGVPLSFKTGVIYPFSDINRVVTFKSLTMHFVPKGNYDFVVTYRIDNGIEQVLNFNQDYVSGDSLDDDFVLDESLLDGDGSFTKIKKEIYGTGSGFSMTVTQTPGIEDQDVEIIGYSIEVEDAEDTNLQVSN